MLRFQSRIAWRSAIHRNWKIIPMLDGSLLLGGAAKGDFFSNPIEKGPQVLGF